MQTLLEHLKSLAKGKPWDDAADFNPADFSGGNFDDAYAGGSADGEIHLARELLRKYFKEELNAQSSNAL